MVSYIYDKYVKAIWHCVNLLISVVLNTGTTGILVTTPQTRTMADSG